MKQKVYVIVKGYREPEPEVYTTLTKLCKDYDIPYNKAQYALSKNYIAYWAGNITIYRKYLRKNI